MRGSYAHTNSDGTPKQSFRTSSMARGARKKAQMRTPVLVMTYRCATCGQFHIGKTNESLDYFVKKKQRWATDERLVGKLIGALREAFRKQTAPASTKEKKG